MTKRSRTVTPGERVRWSGMEQQNVSSPQWTRFAGPARELWQVSQTPVYDSVERQWLAEGREVPRRPGLARRPGLPFGGLRPMTGDDLFRRG